MRTRIAVLNATGQLVRAILRRMANLRDTDAFVTAVCADPMARHSVAAWVDKVKHASVRTPQRLRRAFAGIDWLLLTLSQGDDERSLRRYEAARDAAKRSGVSRVVYLSCLGPCERSPSPWGRLHHAAEAAVSGIADRVGVVVGAPVDHQAVELADYLLDLDRRGIPVELRSRYRGLEEAMREGRLAETSGAFAALAGRSPEAIDDSVIRLCSAARRARSF